MSTEASIDNFIVCHECDQLQRKIALPPGGAATCCRCNALLYRNRRTTPASSLALLLAAAIVFVLANAFPIFSIEMHGIRNATTLFGAVQALWHKDMPLISALVLFTTILAPSVELSTFIGVLSLLHFRRGCWALPWLLRLMLALEPWSMIEVFMLGVLVSLVKLWHMMNIVPGIALWAYAALMVLLAAATATLDARELWDRIPLRS